MLRNELNKNKWCWTRCKLRSPDTVMNFQLGCRLRIMLLELDSGQTTVMKKHMVLIGCSEWKIFWKIWKFLWGIYQRWSCRLGMSSILWVICIETTRKKLNKDQWGVILLLYHIFMFIYLLCWATLIPASHYLEIPNNHSNRCRNLTPLGWYDAILHNMLKSLTRPFQVEYYPMFDLRLASVL